jgi:hypothetical protein
VCHCTSSAGEAIHSDKVVQLIVSTV